MQLRDAHYGVAQQTLQQARHRYFTLVDFCCPVKEVRFAGPMSQYSRELVRTVKVLEKFGPGWLVLCIH
jgi:hypothetical protein